jgi:hypothetical protein
MTTAKSTGRVAEVCGGNPLYRVKNGPVWPPPGEPEEHPKGSDEWARAWTFKLCEDWYVLGILLRRWKEHLNALDTVKLNRRIDGWVDLCAKAEEEGLWEALGYADSDAYFRDAIGVGNVGIRLRTLAKTEPGLELLREAWKRADASEREDFLKEIGKGDNG